jgi:hypothetical protein
MKERNAKYEKGEKDKVFTEEKDLKKLIKNTSTYVIQEFYFRILNF